MAEQIRKAAARGKRISGNNLLLLITILLFVAMYAAGCVIYGAKGFTHFQTFLNLLITNAGLLCVTCGMTCVMLTGGIDISVGSLIAMDCMILADGMTNKHIGAIPLIVFVMVIGVVFGLVQGFLVSYMQIQPFIVTMAGMFFGRGMTAVINTQQVSITMDSSRTFYAWANAKINLPAFLGYMGRRKMIVPFIRPTVIIALLVCVVIALVLKYTKFGRVLYAVGGNEKATRLSGVNTKKVYFIAYANMGLLAGFAGILTIARGGHAEPTYGMGYEMDAIASCFIGGASAYGGVGKITGVIIGAALMGVINQGMSIMGISANYQSAVKGAVLLIAVLVDVLSKKEKA